MTEMSTDFYVEYFKILDNIQNGKMPHHPDVMGLLNEGKKIYAQQDKRSTSKRSNGKKKKKSSSMGGPSGKRKQSFSEPMSTTNKQQHER